MKEWISVSKSKHRLEDEKKNRKMEETPDTRHYQRSQILRPERVSDWYTAMTAMTSPGSQPESESELGFVHPKKSHFAFQVL